MTRLALLVFRALGALGASLLVACVGTKTLEDGQNCPCAPGWTCYNPTNQCVQDTGGMTGAGGEGGAPPRDYDAAEVQAALAHWEGVLQQIGFLDPAVPKRLMPRLNQLLNRAQLRREELHILRGIARAAARKRS